jgi:hypothetical protein
VTAVVAHGRGDSTAARSAGERPLWGARCLPRKRPPSSSHSTGFGLSNKLGHARMLSRGAPAAAPVRGHGSEPSVALFALLVRVRLLC